MNSYNDTRTIAFVWCLAECRIITICTTFLFILRLIRILLQRLWRKPLRIVIIILQWISLSKLWDLVATRLCRWNGERFVGRLIKKRWLWYRAKNDKSFLDQSIYSGYKRKQLTVYWSASNNDWRLIWDGSYWKLTDSMSDKRATQSK